MMNTENIFDILNSKEGQEKMKKYFEEYHAKEAQRNNRMKELLSNVNYLKWLETFTKEYSVFSDNDWLYRQDEISNDDKQNVECLELLYMGIEQYASKNYIYPTNSRFGNFYKIKLDSISYEIGILTGQGTQFFCRRVENIDEQEFIDFSDIIHNKKSIHRDAIKNNLNNLSHMIVSLYESGVPLEAIENELKYTLGTIKAQKEAEQSKVLKKQIRL